MPKDSSHLSKKLTCQSTGNWDKLALRCLPRCGRVTQQSTAYVVNGRKAKNIAEVPWTAAIYKRDVLICGGTIISERSLDAINEEFQLIYVYFRLVVSAAHCFFRELPSSLSESVALDDLSTYKIAAGKYFRDINAKEDFAPQFFNISEIISVPGKQFLSLSSLS